MMNRILPGFWNLGKVQQFETGNIALKNIYHGEEEGHHDRRPSH